MSSYGKFSLGLVFLLIAGTRLEAQWGPSSVNSFPDRGACRDVAVVVTDAAGSGISGADVSTEGAFNETTNSQGVVAIPCQSMKGMMPMLTITAPGYRPARVALMPDAMSHLEVRLDRGDPALRSGGNTVDASELSGSVQKQSAQLQQQAEKALAAKDYDRAEKLLMDALHLTPSVASIANNLGIVALHRKDLDTAGSWFQKAVDEAPYKADILGNLGLVRWMQGRVKESYDILVRASAKGYESGLGHYILGTVDLGNGNSKEAADHLKKVPTGRFPYRDLYLSIALRNCGKNKAADETYQSFLRSHPAPFLISELR